MEPLISLRLREQGRIFYPGEELECEYQFDAVEAEDIQASEASVLWCTEGKGDEDMAVHYFERRTPTDVEEGDLRPLRRFRTVLPYSPLSYCGSILKVRWCVRVRLFLKRGKEYFFEEPFQLGITLSPTLGSAPPDRTAAVTTNAPNRVRSKPDGENGTGDMSDEE